MAWMGQPTDEHKRLHRLAGVWIGDEVLSPSPWGPGGPATGRMQMRVDIDGLFVIQDYSEEKQGRVVYRGHGLFGWDGKQQRYTWFWVDSIGYTPSAPALGRWHQDRLQFETRSELGGTLGRYTYQFTGEDSFLLRIENSRDGGQTWTTFVEGSYRRDQEESRRAAQPFDQFEPSGQPQPAGLFSYP